LTRIAVTPPGATQVLWDSEGLQQEVRALSCDDRVDVLPLVDGRGQTPEAAHRGSKPSDELCVSSSVSFASFSKGDGPRHSLLDGATAAVDPHHSRLCAVAVGASIIIIDTRQQDVAHAVYDDRRNTSAGQLSFRVR
jgi:hypothetical protein